METRVIPVPAGLDGVRTDIGVARIMGFSRNFAADVAESGGTHLDGSRVGKSDRLRAGAVLEIVWTPVEPVRAIALAVPELTVVYDDDDIVVIDKPVGVAAHPTVGWSGPTVVGALLAEGYTISTSGAAERQGIVHRLDVGTSGLMVIAKTDSSYSMLKQAFRDRTVDKVYHAVVQGHLDPLLGTIDAPIARHPRSDWKFAVVSGGKPSVTHYETLHAFRSASLVDVRLETGRTHQIRVHMAAQRHPCVGDTVYGADPVLSAALELKRQWLHAVQLGFEHPRSGQWAEFRSPYPRDLQHSLDVLHDT